MAQILFSMARVSTSDQIRSDSHISYKLNALLNDKL